MALLLIVEDEDQKLRHLEDQSHKFFDDIDIETSRSVNSACEFLDHREPDLIILDMSLPTFDVSSSEGGGRPQGFGGVEVLRYLDFIGTKCSVIVITGYEAFPKGDGQINLIDLEASIAEEFPELVSSVIRFNSAFDTWKEEFDIAVASWLAGKSNT
tara:strand:- start:34 stop:504 length:471 start_codon:yes stop_codon:yes gene_type:complete